MRSTQFELVDRLDEWFAERLDTLQCRGDTRAYVVGVMAKYRGPNDDLSRRSIVLEYVEARQAGDFATYQRIGDWVLWSSVVHPDSFNGHHTVIETMGRMSYYACHRLMRSTWPVYEQLADELPDIARETRELLSQRPIIIGEFVRKQ